MLPTACPLHSTDDQDCRIRINHLRNRKTGPEFPLFVLVCKEHNIGFTLYPPGYYPHSRHTLAPVSPDGSLLVQQRDSHRFSGTLFDAPLDAAAGNVWQQESTENSLTPRLTTQNRHLERIARLFGIGEESAPRQQEEVSQILMVSGQLLHDSTVLLKNGCGTIKRGTIISRILDQIPVYMTIFERLVEVGAAAGLWTTPLFCSPRHLTLHKTPFHPVRTRGSPVKNGDECCHNFVQ